MLNDTDALMSTMDNIITLHYIFHFPLKIIALRKKIAVT